MKETEIIERIRRRVGRIPAQSGLLRGIGDDCAIFRPAPGTDLVFTTDFALEGRHFTREGQTAADIGRRALARSLSDLAAMGARPLFCLVSLAVPEDFSIDGFYDGLLSTAERFSVMVAGGDLSRFTSVVVDIMCCGTVPKGEAMQRSGAVPGDDVYVTGPLGAAAVSGWTQMPTPRIEFGLRLRGAASAAMDLSDGLSLDLQRLCVESGVSAQLASNLIPIAEGASLKQALHGGEDYELLFTCSFVPADLPAVRIGSIVAGLPGQVLLDGQVLQAEGFDHFA